MESEPLLSEKALQDELFVLRERNQRILLDIRARLQQFHRMGRSLDEALGEASSNGEQAALRKHVQECEEILAEINGVTNFDFDLEKQEYVLMEADASENCIKKAQDDEPVKDNLNHKKQEYHVDPNTMKGNPAEWIIDINDSDSPKQQQLLRFCVIM